MLKRASDNNRILSHKRTCLEKTQRMASEPTWQFDGLNMRYSCQPCGVTNSDEDLQINAATSYSSLQRIYANATCQFCEPGCTTCFKPCPYSCVICGNNNNLIEASNKIMASHDSIQQTWNETAPYDAVKLTCLFCKTDCSVCWQPCIYQCTTCSASDAHENVTDASSSNSSQIATSYNAVQTPPENTCLLSQIQGSAMEVNNPVTILELNTCSPYETTSISEMPCQHCKLDCSICYKPCAAACKECGADKTQDISINESDPKIVTQLTPRKRTFEVICPWCALDCTACKKPCRYECIICKQSYRSHEQNCVWCKNPYGQCKCCEVCVPDCTQCQKPCYSRYSCLECRNPCKNCEVEFADQQCQSSSDRMQCGICVFREKMKRRFSQWTSDNEYIDQIIQDSQLMTRDWRTYLEWIDPKRLVNIHHIADGGFGSVYSARWLDHSNQYQGMRYRPESVALKTLKCQDIINENILNEIKNSFKISNNHTPTVYGISKLLKSNEYVIVMEYFERGSLCSMLNKRARQYPWDQYRIWIMSVAAALVEVHKQDIIHCDLHSGNILVGIRKSPKISDFGLSQALSDAAAARRGSYGILPYMAPELLEGKPNTKATDIYALGIIMWEVASGQLPFSDWKHGPKLMMDICKGLRPPAIKSIPECWLELIEKCWDADPSKRPTAKELHEELSKPIRRGHLKKAKEFRRQNPEQLKVTRHPQVIYTSRFIPHLKTLTADALNDDDWDSVLENMK